MSSTTPNIGLTKVASSETIGDLQTAMNGSGGNMDILDAKIGPVGNTSIQAQINALSNMFAFQRGDEWRTRGGNFVFRTLTDRSAIYFAIRLPKEAAANVNNVTVEITANSPTWFTGGSLGNVQSGATVSNVSLAGARSVVQFSVPVPNTIPEAGFGICALNATITFTA